MQNTLQSSAKELNTLYSAAKGFLSSVVMPGSGSGSKSTSSPTSNDDDNATTNVDSKEPSSSSSSSAQPQQCNDGDDVPSSTTTSSSTTTTTSSSSGSEIMGKAVTDAATNAIYSSLKFTGMALNAVSDLAAAAERGVNKAQQEAAARKTATVAFIDALQALNKPPISVTSTWNEVAAALPDSQEYAVLSQAQRKQAFNVYVDALQRAARAAAQQATAGFVELLKERDPPTTLTYDKFRATKAVFRDARFVAKEDDDERRSLFDSFIAKRKAEEERALAEIAAEAERAAAGVQVEKAAEIAKAAKIAKEEEENKKAAQLSSSSPSAAAAAPPKEKAVATEVPDLQQLEFLKAEQARLKDEYSRMEVKLKEMEKTLAVQNLAGSSELDDDRDDDSNPEVIEFDDKGNVIFRFSQTSSSPSSPGGKKESSSSSSKQQEDSSNSVTSSRDYY